MEFVDVLVNNGVAVAVVLYFLWKDATITKENTEILQEVKSLLKFLIGERSEENEIK